MDLNYELKILKSEKDKIEMTYKELKDELVYAKNTNIDLESKFSTQISVIYEKEQKVSELENGSKNLKAQIDEKNFKTNELLKSKRYLENCCSDMQNTIDLLGDEIQLLKNKAFNLEDNLTKSEMRSEFCNKENHDYKEKIIDLKSKISRLEDNLMISNSTVKDNENILEDLKTSLNCKKLEVDNLQRKINSLTEQLENDKHTINDHMEGQKVMQEDLDAYINQAQGAEISYRNQILELHLSKNHLEEEVCDYKNQLEREKSNNARLKVKSEELENYVTKLNIELEEKQLLIEPLEDEIRLVKKDNYIVQNMLTAEGKKVQNLHSSIIDLENERIELNGHIKAIQQEMYYKKYKSSEENSPDKLSMNNLFESNKFGMEQTESRSITSNEETEIEQKSSDVKIEEIDIDEI